MPLQRFHAFVAVLKYSSPICGSAGALVATLILPLKFEICVDAINYTVVVVLVELLVLVVDVLVEVVVLVDVVVLELVLVVDVLVEVVDVEVLVVEVDVDDDTTYWAPDHFTPSQRIHVLLVVL